MLYNRPMVDFLNEVSKWVLYFFIYSIVGWVFESLYCSLKAKPVHFINRGFLFGPLCPIYGAGIVSIIFIMQPFRELSFVAEFLIGAVVCSAIEYTASLVMEKFYHVRWWCYKNSWYNITLNGRISFWTSFWFGVAGLVVINYVHPSIEAFVNSFSPALKIILSAALIVIFFIDNLMSNAAAISVKNTLKGGKVDLTDEIKKFAYNYYKKQTRKTRHLAKKILKTMKKTQKKARKKTKKNGVRRGT